jgi:hypothetical protein
LSARVSYLLGNQTLALDPVVAVDLTELSRHHDFEVSGVIGYPALVNSVLTVNYRDSLIHLQPKSNRQR